MSVISTIEYSHRSPQSNTGPWLIMGQKIMFLVLSHVHCKLLSLCFADGCSDSWHFRWYTGFLGILLVCVMKLLFTWKLWYKRKWPEMWMILLSCNIVILLMKRHSSGSCLKPFALFFSTIQCFCSFT